MRGMRLDDPLVAQLQAHLQQLPIDREELRGPLSCSVAAWTTES
jgi:hypothetical protein